MCAVANLVSDVGTASEGVVRGQHLALQGGVAQLQARVHHADLDAGAVAGSQLVGIRCADLVQPALDRPCSCLGCAGAGFDQGRH